MMVLFSAASTPQGFAQALETMLSGVAGWLLLAILVISAVVCAMHSKWPAFFMDLAGVLFVSYFVFNGQGAIGMMHSVANSL